MCFEFDGDGNSLEFIVEEESWLGRIDEPALKKIAAAGLSALSQEIINHTNKDASKSPQRLVVIMLSNDENIQALNKTYRGKDKPTNVLSFPSNDWQEAGDTENHLGDAILALETVVSEAEVGEKPLTEHVSHLVIHGVLHLLGYDHETDADAKIMETLETTLMHQLAYENPYDEQS